jgi:hypothetical protein
MMSPQYRLNAQRMRQERQLRAGLTVATLALAAVLGVIVLGTAHTTLTLARTLPDLLLQAHDLKGM